jgi:excisionase family DNA binding protein
VGKQRLPDNDKLLRVPAVAEWLNCSDSNVYSLVAAGELKCYRVGHGKAGIRFSAEQVQNFLRARETGGQSVKEPPAPRPIKLKHLEV